MSALHYQVHQQELNKPWILLIHGLFGSLDNLAALRRGLSDEFNILSIDLPDHGKSISTQEFSFKNYARLIRELIEQFHITRLNIVGHSLGGKIAMQLALEGAELIERLVVLDIAPVNYPPRHQAVFRGLENVELEQLKTRQDADLAMQASIQDASTRQFLLKSLERSENGWQWQFNLPLLKRDYAKISAGLDADTPCQAPTLFIKGALSDYLTAEHKTRILQLFPNSQLKILANTGHWLHAEKPALCCNMIKSFLS